MPLKVGIQLYSVKNAIAGNPRAVLEKLAETGYRYVEAANHNAGSDPGVGFGLPAREMRQTLEEFGLKIVGCHVNPLREELLPAVLDYHAELGNTQIGCDIEFYPYGDLDYLKRRCEMFNHIGELCRERGMRYYYHNHFQEFQRFGDELVYDLIMENTDPDLVYAELDTYWAARGGQDPAELIRRYQDRVILLHQKDFPAAAAQPLNMYDGAVDFREAIDMELFLRVKEPDGFTEIGTGTLPIQNYIEAAESCPNLDYILLEQDATRLDEMESIQISMQAFRKFKGVEL